MLRDRRTLLTVATLVVVLGAVAWTFFGPSPAVPRAGRTGGAGRPAAAEAAPLPAAEGVRLTALTSPRVPPSEATRDPFRFRSRAAATAGQASEAVAAPPTLTPVAPPQPTGPPPPPPIPLKFIGVVERVDGLKLAVLSQGEGRAPMHGKEGDIIDGRYRILRIGAESIEMAYLDGRGRQTIRLTGQ